MVQVGVEAQVAEGDATLFRLEKGFDLRGQGQTLSLKFSVEGGSDALALGEMVEVLPLLERF